VEVNRKKMTGKEETVVVSTRIPKSLYRRMKEVMKINGFLNVSDFLRYAIRLLLD